MIDEADAAKLLGRSLTSIETDNFDLYLNIATERLEQLICTSLEQQAEDAEASERTYETRSGYRSLYMDPFSDITSVSINDEAIDEDQYTIKQNDNLNGDWYNIVQFKTKRSGENVVVSAKWGFSPVPDDLQYLLARLFAQVSVEQTSDNSVKSKRIEDFQVTYKDSATFDDFVTANQAIIDKYAQCDGLIRHGAVGRGFRSFYDR